MILDSKKIEYDKVDIAAAGNDDAKQKMREVMGDPQGLPPQLTKGNTYLGVSFILTYKSITFFASGILFSWYRFIGISLKTSPYNN